MNNRFMRVIVFFDLPMTTVEERRVYTRFRKNLLREGFIMLQESVYSKLVLNANSASLLRKRIHRISPQKGIIQLLTVTEKQYSNMEYIVGKNISAVMDNTDRLVII